MATKMARSSACGFDVLCRSACGIPSSGRRPVQNPDGFRHLRQVAAGRIKQKEVDLAASGDLLQKIHQRPRNSSMIQIITDKKNLLLLHRFCPAFPVSGTAASRRKSSGRYFFTT